MGDEGVLMDRLVSVQPFVASISPAHEASLVSHYISLHFFNTPLGLKKNGVGCNCILSDACVITLLQSQRQQQFSNTHSACLKSHSWQFGVEMVSTKNIKTLAFRSHFQLLHADHASSQVNSYFCVPKNKL